MAFQFPEEGIEDIRKLWKQPNAQPGNWLIKVGIGTVTQKYRVISNEKFHERFRRPLHGSRPVLLSEEDWNKLYSRNEEEGLSNEHQEAVPEQDHGSTRDYVAYDVRSRQLGFGR